MRQTAYELRISDWSSDVCSSYLERRIRAWWTLVWSAIVRMSSVLLWAPFSLFLVAPWVIDGFVLREIRKNTFDFSSPIQQRYAMRAKIGRASSRERVCQNV